MMQVYSNNLFPEVEEFKRDQELELSIDGKIFKNLINKSYFHFSSFLNELVSSYKSNKDNYNLNNLKDFLRNKRNYISRYEFLNVLENYYLSNLENHVRNLNYSLNNIIDKDPIDHAVESLMAAIRSGVSMISLHKYVGLDNFSYSDYSNGCVIFYLHRRQVKIIVCNDEKLLSISDISNMTIVIYAGSSDVNLSSIKKCTNIYRIYIQNGAEDFIYLPIGNPFQSAFRLYGSFVRKTRDSIKRYPLLNQFDFEINSLWDEFYRLIDNCSPYGVVELEHNLFEKLKEIRKNVERIDNLALSHFHHLRGDLLACINFLKIAYGTLKFYVNLNKKIEFCISRIKKNHTMYIKAGASVDDKNLLFSEENFSSILAVNLESLFFADKYSSVDCESRVGKGRSDIEIKINRKTIAFIESKVINSEDGISKKITEGIDQVFSRYSENFTLNGDPSIKLYLVLFSYDKNISDFSGKIMEELNSYSLRNGLEFEKIDEKENLLRFSYLKKDSHFESKLRFIDIVVCNLELGRKKKIHDRMKKSTYQL